MKTKTLRGILIFWTLFIGIGAVVGTIMMLVDTTGSSFGMAPMLPYFQKLPFSEFLFQSFLFPGIALFLVNGITNFTAYFLLRNKSRYGGIAGMICGILLMLWICVQFYIFPLNFMSTIYFVFGLLEALTGFALYKRQREEI